VARPKQRTPELRDRVLQVAITTLASDGPGAVTTRRVAEQAETSTPAVYELFGDKAGLVREVFFEGFRLLHSRLVAVGETADPRADLMRAIDAFRAFVREHAALAALMFSRSFTDFDPGPAEVRAGRAVRDHIVARVRRCTEAGILHGDPTDIAHVLVALAQGVAAQDAAGWLGTSKTSRDRRWNLAVGAALDGLARRHATGGARDSRERRHSR
jgi:AcrR family transcriptional regulator